MGLNAVSIFGNPAYYHRLGFENAEKYHVTTSGGENFVAFMPQELYEGALKEISGKFYEDSVFQITKE